MPSLRTQPWRSVRAALPIRRAFHSTTWRRQYLEAQTTKVYAHKPLFSIKRLILFATYTTGTYFLAEAMLVRWLESEGWAPEDGPRGEEEDELRSSDVSVFLPMQYPKQLPQTFYKQSDPEWQEFVKMSWDEPRKEAIREALAFRVVADVAKHPVMRKRLGSDIALTKCWFDVKYPDGPPPDYARKGLEFTDSYIAWSTQTIPHTHFLQLDRIMWPRALYHAITNSVYVFGVLQAIKVKLALGLTLSPLDKRAQKISMSQAMLTKMIAAEKEKAANSDGKPGTPSSPSFGSQGLPPLSFPGIPYAGNSLSSPSSREQPEDVEAKPSLLSKAMISVRIHDDLIVMWKVFVSMLSRMHSQSVMEFVPRGCFVVFGHLEIVGSRGRCKVEVSAAYDPKTSSYTSLSAKVKHFWDLEQPSRGGP